MRIGRIVRKINKILGELVEIICRFGEIGRDGRIDRELGNLEN